MTRPNAELPPDLLRRLRASTAFGDADADALQALAAGMQRLRAGAGEPVLSSEDPVAGLLLVLSGRLEVTDRASHAVVARTVGPGEAIDELQVLAGGRQVVRVVASEETELGRVDGTSMDRVAARHPALRRAVERIHRRQLLSRLHTLLGTMDREFLDQVEEMADWVHLPRGRLLFEQNSRSEGIYLVVSGRIRTSSYARDGSVTVLGEAGRGEVTGEMAFFGVEQRDERVQAVRDSILVGFTSEEFERLVAIRPQILRQVTRTLVERLRRAPTAGTAATQVTNVALIPASEGVRLGEVASRLASALAAFGTVLHLTSERTGQLMHEPGIAEAWGDTADCARLVAWLNACEANHRFVLYEADPRLTLWTRRCVRQADRVLLVADADRDPRPGELERALEELEGQSTDASAALVLLQPEGTVLPAGTSRWLAGRRVQEHHHVRRGREADFSRLARFLAGRAVGLVLGGGGARGFAHIGILRALEEAGIPVDVIGGTSMGAAVAAQYAMEWSPDRVAAMFRRVYVEIKPQTEYTLPLLSMVSTRKADQCGVMVYGEADIEDLWTPYFCISSNLTTAEMVVHRRGLLRKATLASSSLPGFVPPVVEGCDLLVDGAILNNVPTDVMRQLGCGTVIASEVSVEDDATFTCDRVPSPWELLRSRFRRGAPAKRFPSLIELAVRASLLHSTSRQNQAVLDADFCFHPPIDRFGMVDFLLVDEIVAVGYEHGRQAIPTWREDPAFQKLIHAPAAGDPETGEPQDAIRTTSPASHP